MAKVLSCAKCSFETSETVTRCPNCGGRLQSAKKVRVLGWLLLVIGAFLVIFMGALGIYLGQIITQTDQSTSTTRFTGGPNDVGIDRGRLRFSNLFWACEHGGRHLANRIWEAESEIDGRDVPGGMILVVIARAIELIE